MNDKIDSFGSDTLWPLPTASAKDLRGEIDPAASFWTWFEDSQEHDC
jgi:hypothetical protein